MPAAANRGVVPYLSDKAVVAGPDHFHHFHLIMCGRKLLACCLCPEMGCGYVA